ncbi:MAG: alpha/beta hydrolase [Deltaproteobacteria bacterium]|jgi:pimeloyl-ACP methyl ester carboxylesterase|nr:alpha/beta hydrolase [Deltaproteobacteria bacterium]
MSIVVSNKQKVHYELAGDKGPWMLLHTPHMIPMSAWKEAGYVKQLEQDFRLVMIEPLGQGLSDAPEDASHYTIASRIRHILDILREVQADYTFFLGVGLGAQVGFQMSKEFPRRIRSLISIGAQPYQELEEAKYLKEKLEQLRSGNVSAYLQQWHSLDHLSNAQENMILQGNPEAYALGLEESINWEGLGDDLKSLGTATLLFTAKAEPRFLSVRDAGKRLRYGRYIILPKVLQNHGLWSSELIMEPLLEFTRRDNSN